MMPNGATAYVVVRREDGFGDVCALAAGQRYTLGRATTNRIVLKDELCSREHAEIYYADGRWRLRDLNSLNGTRVNETVLDGEWELSPQDEIHLGRTHLVFVEDVAELPDPAMRPADSGGVAIKKRLGHTRFLTPIPPTNTSEQTPAPHHDHNLNRELSLLYRLALDMGSASDIHELVGIVLDGLLEAIPADVGAILSVKEGQKLEVLDHRQRDSSARGYRPVSEYVSNEVLGSHEAILAVDIAGDRHLSNRESLADMGARSLICAPVMFQDKVLALIHLYCTQTPKGLDAENLEFAMAVAKHLGAAIHQMTRQMSLTAENRSLRDQLRVESELVGASTPIKSVEHQI